MNNFFLDGGIMNFNQSVTKENLARAFAGICQDGARYQFIAKTAVSEGFNAISDELKTIAKHKMAHASVLYQIMLENIEEDSENINIEAGYPFEQQFLETSLQISSEIEENEGKIIFPHFAKIAHDEGFEKIEETLLNISKVNLADAKKLKFLAEKFDSEKLYKSDKSQIWTCSNCGHSENRKSAWQTCPLCSYPQGYVCLEDEEN